MNKAEIIERLLEQGHITVAEAMTLMTPEVQTVYYGTITPYISPHLAPPWEVTCGTK
jgi:hypothetical protein